MSIDMHLEKGWSMISLPVIPNNTLSSSMFPDAVVIYAYEKGTGYDRISAQENLEARKGYWILMDEAKTYTLSGETIDEYNLSIQDGWYMIGGCTLDAKPSGVNCNIIVIYGYAQGVGYKRIQDGESLKTGKGYWILLKDVTGPAVLTVK